MTKNKQKRCSLCGKELDFWDLNENYAIEKPHLGYGSAHDGEPVHLRICCGCFDKLVESCVVSPLGGDD